MRKPKDYHVSFLVYASDDTQPTGEQVIIDATDWKLRICRNIWDDNLTPIGDSDLETDFVLPSYYELAKCKRLNYQP